MKEPEQGQIDELRAEIAELRKQLEAATWDGDRYRKLRNEWAERAHRAESQLGEAQKEINELKWRLAGSEHKEER